MRSCMPTIIRNGEDIHASLGKSHGHRLDHVFYAVEQGLGDLRLFDRINKQLIAAPQIPGVLEHALRPSHHRMPLGLQAGHLAFKVVVFPLVEVVGKRVRLDLSNGRRAPQGEAGSREVVIVRPAAGNAPFRRILPELKDGRLRFPLVIFAEPFGPVDRRRNEPDPSRQVQIPIDRGIIGSGFRPELVQGRSCKVESSRRPVRRPVGKRR